MKKLLAILLFTVSCSLPNHYGGYYAAKPEPFPYPNQQRAYILYPTPQIVGGAYGYPPPGVGQVLYPKEYRKAVGDY